MDPLNDFQNMPKEKNLWEKEKENEEYKKWTLNLDNAKNDLKNQLWYWSFVPKEDWKQKEKNLDLKKLSEENKENKYFPVLERLLDKGMIDEKVFSDIFNDIKDDWEIDFDKFDLGENELKIQEILKKIPKDEKKWQEDLWKESLNNKQEDENRETFYKDFPEIKKTVDNQDEKDDNKLKMNVIYEKVWKNYIKIDSWNTNNNEKNENQNKEDKEKDYSLAIKTTANQEINKTKNLNKDSETYKKAIELINWSETIEKQLEWLQKLDTYIYWIQWMYWEKNKNQNNKDQNNKEKLKQELTTEQKNLITEYNNTKLEIEKKWETLELKTKLLVIIEKAKIFDKNKETQKIAWVISWWEEDKIGEAQWNQEIA